MAFKGAVLDLCNRAVSEKNPQYFGPPLPAEYKAVFSGQTDAPEVRCDLADRQTEPTTVILACTLRVNQCYLYYSY